VVAVNNAVFAAFARATALALSQQTATKIDDISLFANL